MKLMIIDGNSIVNRAFYGIRMLNAPDGTPTNAVYGFLTIMQKLLEEEKPQGICVCFDLKAPTFRHEQYSEYKAQRKGMPQELAVQMPVLKEVLDAMGIKRYELEGWEADDLLGTIARLCEQAGAECRVVTGDKDSFQLITEMTHVLHVKSQMGQTRTIEYTPELFAEEFGMEPLKMVDLKALMGDSSDNIPGVKGIGEKTALELLHRFGSLEGVYGGLASPEIKEGVRKKLQDGREMAFLSYDLATIRRDAPLEFSPEDIFWNREFRPEIYDLFIRLGFTKFIEKFKLSPAGGSALGQSSQSKREVRYIRNREEAAEAARQMENGVANICADGGTDRIAICPEKDDFGWVLTREEYNGDYVEALKMLFAPGIKKAGHNVKDLQRELLKAGIVSENWVFDAALAAYLLEATAGSYEIPRLCVKYCGFEPGVIGDDQEGQMSLLDTPDPDKEAERLLSLASALAEIRKKTEPLLRENGMEKLYYEIELPLCSVLAEMENTGFLVDRGALKEFGEMLSERIDELQGQIWELAGAEFNIASPKQLGSILFEKLMLPSGKKTKTGWSTSADTLEKLRDKHPIVNAVLEYRQLTKLKSTYAEGLLKAIGSDGRLRTNFQMTVTATGRLSSTEPNLQNIPVRTELGAKIREMFVAAPGNVLVDADYSQIELRLLAHISGDPAMTEAFRTGEDIHTVTASQVFGVAPEEVTSTQRSHAKAVNFGIVYGISPFSLAQDIGVFQNEARAYMDAYLSKYHGVKAHMTDIVVQAKKDGYVTTLFGRRRSLPELSSSNHNLRSFGERVALNMPIQGTAADIMKLAMVNVFRCLKKECPEAKLLLQVHDELIVECPEDEAEKVRDILIREMEQAVAYSVPLTVEAHWGQSWSEAK